MSFADHHVIPGKKFWTWGNGPRGRMWDQILTDDDGPYIELMVGAYSDNQPDYSWLQPYETKSFEMFWYPFRGIGGVKMANLDAAVNLEVHTNGTATVGFCTTAAHKAATVTLTGNGRSSEKVEINPAKPFTKSLTLPANLDAHDVRASLTSEGKELVAYPPVRLDEAVLPPPVTGPPAPARLNPMKSFTWPASVSSNSTAPAAAGEVLGRGLKGTQGLPGEYVPGHPRVRKTAALPRANNIFEKQSSGSPPITPLQKTANRSTPWVGFEGAGPGQRSVQCLF